MSNSKVPIVSRALPLTTAVGSVIPATAKKERVVDSPKIIIISLYTSFISYIYYYMTKNGPQKRRRGDLAFPVVSVFPKLPRLSKTPWLRPSMEYNDPVSFYTIFKSQALNNRIERTEFFEEAQGRRQQASVQRYLEASRFGRPSGWGSKGLSSKNFFIFYIIMPLKYKFVVYGD